MYPAKIGNNNDGQSLFAISKKDSVLLVSTDENDSDPVPLSSFLAHTHGATGWTLDQEKINDLA
jgi:hypothetical protein